MRTTLLAAILLPLSGAVALADPPSAFRLPSDSDTALARSAIQTPALLPPSAGDDDREALLAPAALTTPPVAPVRAAAREDSPEPKRKRMTRMPWMTGVYQ